MRMRGLVKSECTHFDCRVHYLKATEFKQFILTLFNKGMSPWIEEKTWSFNHRLTTALDNVSSVAC